MAEAEATPEEQAKKPSGDQSEDPYESETLRLAELLHALVKQKGRSVRSLEKKMGVGDSVFAKVLRGHITLHVRHVLLLCDALGITARDFFELAYPPPKDAEAERPFEDRVIDVLVNVGLLAPDRRPPSPEQ